MAKEDVSYIYIYIYIYIYKKKNTNTVYLHIYMEFRKMVKMTLYVREQETQR